MLHNPETVEDAEDGAVDRCGDTTSARVGRGDTQTRIQTGVIRGGKRERRLSEFSRGRISDALRLRGRRREEGKSRDAYDHDSHPGRETCTGVCYNRVIHMRVFSINKAEHGRPCPAHECTHPFCARGEAGLLFGFAETRWPS